jgi:dolichol-phosphate mannosyltransferase
MACDLPFLSIVIPAHNEEEGIASTCRAITTRFAREKIADFDIVVVNDNSTDRTEDVLRMLVKESDHVSYVNNAPPHGFGYAVRRGIDVSSGEALCIVMGDLSDSPDDIVTYYRKLKGGAECVFGSRFIAGSNVVDYPRLKLVLNRLTNWFIKIVFGIHHNDITNAFKAYRREVVEGIKPLISSHFNLTVELPLKSIVRGYTFVTVPISWTNRVTGTSKLKLQEMGSRYLFIVLYVLLEKLLTKKDYHRITRSQADTLRQDSAARAGST